MTPGGVYRSFCNDGCNGSGYYEPYPATMVPPTAGGSVYIRVALNGAIPNGVVGGLEAVADGANTVLYPNFPLEDRLSGK